MAWAPAYASGAELASWLKVEADDPELALATEAASRAIDLACGRQFGFLSSSEFRYFHAEYWRGTSTVKIDDLMTANSLLIESGDTELTEFTLLPLNAPAKGKPWTEIEFPTSVSGPLRISARWGWTTVPGAIKQATLIQAARFYDRRTSPGGAMTSKRIDDVSYGWSSNNAGAEDLDADVLVTIRPYRKLWSAA